MLKIIKIWIWIGKYFSLELIKRRATGITTSFYYNTELKGLK